MNYKRLREFPTQEQDFDGAHQPFTKRSRIDDEEFLDFSNPPDNIFDKLKIPRRINHQISTDVNIPLISDTVSPILPPFPQLEDHLIVGQTDDPVTKAVVDNITGKLSTRTPKQIKYYRCKECNLFLSGQASLDAHLVGARHAKKIKELELNGDGIDIDVLKKDKVKKLAENKFMCKLCNVSACSLVMIKSHIDGSKHAKKMKAYREKKNDKSKSIDKSSKPKPIDETPTIHQGGKTSSILDSSQSQQLCTNDSKTASVKPGTGKVFYCDVCGLCMNSQMQYDQHVNSKKHAAKVNKFRISANESELKTTPSAPDDNS